MRIHLLRTLEMAMVVIGATGAASIFFAFISFVALYDVYFSLTCILVGLFLIGTAIGGESWVMRQKWI